jgi:hypothetical protein
VIKLLVERDCPPTFDLTSDKEVARHARISVNAIAELAGRFHWLCTYATGDKLFSVIVVDDETAYDAWVEKTKAYTVGLKIRPIVRSWTRRWPNSNGQTFMRRRDIRASCFETHAQRVRARSSDRMGRRPCR